MEIATLPDAHSASDAVRRETSMLLQRARNTLGELARFHARRGERYDEALQRNNIGLDFYYDGNYAAAVCGYRAALALYDALGEHYRQAQVAQNIALVDWERGRFAAALLGYDHALSVLDRNASPQLYADILNNAAMANFATGKLDRALRQHTTAFEIMTRLQQPREQARSLYGIASIYAAVGDRDLAKSFLAQSLELRSAALDARGRVGSLRALALLAAQDGEPQEALRLNHDALLLATDPPVRVAVLTQIAETESLLGHGPAATDALTLASSVAAHADRITQAKVDLEYSAVERRAGRYDAARRDAARALHTFRRFALARRSFDADLALAEVEAADAHNDAALLHLDHAIELAEDIRAEAASPDFRAGSMQPLRPAFDRKIELLATRYTAARRRGDPITARAAAFAALEVSERARARAMADVSAAQYSPKAEAEVARLNERKTALLRELAARQYQRALRADSSAIHNATHPTIRPTMTTAQTNLLAPLRHQITALDARITVLGRTGRTHPDTRFKAQPWSVRLASLPRDVALVSYWMTPARAYAWVLARGDVQFFDLGEAAPIRAAATAVDSTQRSIREGTTQARLTAAAILSDAILRQPFQGLPAAISRVIFIADQTLHYVSFAALPDPADGAHFLIEKFDIAYAPGVANLLRNQPHNSTSGRMLLVDDAVYGRADPRRPNLSSARSDDDRPPSVGMALTRLAETERYERLPGTAAEANAISTRLPASAIDRLEGFDASRARVLTMQLPAYQYIHFAVHGMSDPDIPQLSSLILSQYGNDGQRVDDHL
jgi:tetratricopeptide (TPR) repeat protein